MMAWMKNTSQNQRLVLNLAHSFSSMRLPSMVYSFSSDQSSSYQVCWPECWIGLGGCVGPISNTIKFSVTGSECCHCTLPNHSWYRTLECFVFRGEIEICEIAEEDCLGSVSLKGNLDCKCGRCNWVTYLETLLVLVTTSISLTELFCYTCRSEGINCFIWDIGSVVEVRVVSCCAI